ncbi:MAG: FAD-dependent oxidoreductase [Candidatus Nanopelagicales bacterium]
MANNKGNVVIIGSGPGAYEAALVARQLGAAVTLIPTHSRGSRAINRRRVSFDFHGFPKFVGLNRRSRQKTTQLE